MKILKSNIDSSINIVEQQLIGFLESRYVRRYSDYFTAYLSSQTGCNRGCKMCHLTTTKQTQFVNCDMQDFVIQLESILKQYDNDVPAKWVNLAFMARGEILANPTVTETGTELLYRLGNVCKERNLPVKFNASTIIPKTLRKSLVDCFPFITPTIYYSIYSTNSDFRKEWLPAAMDLDQSLRLLRDYQKFSKKIIKFHNAFIQDENDSQSDIMDMMHQIKKHKIVGEFNIVRYNPYSEEQGKETSEENLQKISNIIQNYMPCKIITKIGSDIFASCGQFLSKKLE